MTYRCQDTLERLVEAATGRLPPDARTGIAAHLAACPACRQEASAIEATVARLRGAGGIGVPPGFWVEFMDRLQARIAQEQTSLSGRMRRWLAAPRHAWVTAAATVATAAVIALALQARPAPPADPDLARARGLVTETMVTTLPHLGEMLDVWRAGLITEFDPAVERTRR